MKTLTFDTNINCNSCVAKVTPFFSNNSAISSWSVDTQSPQKKLTVQGNINEKEVVELVQKAGFQVKNGNAPLVEEVPACHMPEHTSAKPQQIAMDHSKMNHHNHSERYDFNNPNIKAAPMPQTSFWGDKAFWKRASINTFNCLIGCTIGDFGMIIYLQAYHPHTPMMTTMLLAMIAGLITSILLETFLLKIREKLTLKQAFTMAIGMSMISMIAMELAMNITDFVVAGGKPDMHSHIYWIAFAVASVAGFLAPLPYNYYKLKKFNKACH